MLTWFCFIFIAVADSPPQQSPLNESSSAVLLEEEHLLDKSEEEPDLVDSDNELEPEDPLRVLHQHLDDLSDADLFAEIASLQRAGKTADAQLRIDYMSDHGSSPALAFYGAKNAELEERFETALEGYRAIDVADLEPDFLLQVRYREALVLGDLGRHRESLRSFRRLRKSSELRKSDRPVVDLGWGTAAIYSGGWWRTLCGVKKINRALGELPETRSAWMQTRARDALVSVLLKEAEAVSFNARRLNRQINQRSELIRSAELQVVAMIQLGEPEYALRGVMGLADAYLQLYDELIAAPHPKSFSSAQVALYRQRMRAEAAPIRRTALSYYTKGINYAIQVGWEGQILEQLEHRKDALRAELTPVSID